MKKYLYLLTISIIFLFSANFLIAASCPIGTESAVKSPDSSSVYYITDNCTKRPFKNPDKFFSYFSSWNDVSIVSKEKLGTVSRDRLGFMPWGPMKNFKQGTLVKTVTDPKVYLLQQNQKCWLKSEKVFNTLNYKFSWITDVDPGLLDRYPTCNSPISYTDHHPPGTLVKYRDSNNVYILKEQNNELQKKLIKSEQEFEDLGYRWDRIVTIDKEEVYPNYDNQRESISENETEEIQQDKTSSADNKIYKGDGEQVLKAGDKFIANNGVGVKINNIEELNQEQQDKFNDDSFWVTLDFYLQNKKLTVTPVRYIGSIGPWNGNKDYALDVKYKYINEQEVSIKIESLENNINSCVDLVNECKQKGQRSSVCEKKYCAAGKLGDEQEFSQNNITVFAPGELSDLAEKLVTEADQCYSDVADYLKISPLSEGVFIRMKYGKGAALTSNYGISWPVNRDNLDKIRENWNSYNSNDCENNLLAHELTHHFTLEVSADDIYHEGIANYAAEQATSANNLDTTCYENSWQGNNAKSHVSTVQSQCFNSCMSSCSSQAQIVEIEENKTYKYNNKEIKITEIQPERFWEGTNETGAYHGYINYELYEDGSKIKSGRQYIGDMVNSDNLSFMPKAILVQKIIYPDRTEKKYFVKLKLLTGTNSQCSNNCINTCDKRIDGNKMEYVDLDEYKEKPWSQTYKMFYNTSQCLFQKADESNPGSFQDIIQEAGQAREEVGELCIGESIETHTDASTYSKLQSIFDIDRECKYKYPLLGNIDCWNQSCMQNSGIK